MDSDRDVGADQASSPTTTVESDPVVVPSAVAIEIEPLTENVGRLTMSPDIEAAFAALQAQCAAATEAGDSDAEVMGPPLVVRAPASWLRPETALPRKRRLTSQPRVVRPRSGRAPRARRVAQRPAGTRAPPDDPDEPEPPLGRIIEDLYAHRPVPEGDRWTVRFAIDAARRRYIESTRVCPRCGVEQALDAFAASHTWCRSCKASDEAARRAARRVAA